MTGLLDLPNEINLLIAQRLPPRDYVHLSLTCRHLSRLLDQLSLYKATWLEWNTQKLRSIGQHEDRDLLLNLIRHPEYADFIETLDCSDRVGRAAYEYESLSEDDSHHDHEFWPQQAVEAPIIISILESNRFTQEPLDFADDDEDYDNPDDPESEDEDEVRRGTVDSHAIWRAVSHMRHDAFLTQLLTVLPNLRSLTMHTKYLTSSRVLLTFLKRLVAAYAEAAPRLSEDMSWPGLPLQNLQHVSFQEQRTEVGQIWPHLLIQIPSLISLQCEGIGLWEDNCRVYPNEMMIVSNLRSLRLHECYMSVPAIRRLLGDINTLEEFAYGSSHLDYYMSKGIMQALEKTCAPSIKLIIIGDAYDAASGQDLAISHTLLSFPNLRQLSCSWRDFVPKDSTEKLASLLPTTLSRLVLKRIPYSASTIVNDFLMNNLGDFPHLISIWFEYEAPVKYGMATGEYDTSTPHFLEQTNDLIIASGLKWSLEIDSYINVVTRNEVRVDKYWLADRDDD